jgi:hypothetical protein
MSERFIAEDKTMASDHEIRNDPESLFSYGVRELRESKKIDQALSLSLVEPVKGSGASRGFDPYNTSGSFDRTKHWTRVGKR